MTKTFTDIQVLGKDGVEATLKSFTVASKGAQAIAVETTDYARKSFEQSAAAAEKTSTLSTGCSTTCCSIRKWIPVGSSASAAPTAA